MMSRLSIAVVGSLVAFATGSFKVNAASTAAIAVSVQSRSPCCFQAHSSVTSSTTKPIVSTPLTSRICDSISYSSDECTTNCNTLHSSLQNDRSRKERRNNKRKSIVLRALPRHQTPGGRIKYDQQVNWNSSQNNRKMCICHMNKVPNYFDILKEGNENSNLAAGNEEASSKRGVVRRIRDKLFGGNEEVDDESGENDKSSKSNKQSKQKPPPTENDPDIGYKPNLVDSLRLKMALAMSGISNSWGNLFSRSKQEWVVACPKTRVGPGQITPCVVNGLDIIIFASRDGKRLDAFANSCPHLGSPFDLATVERKMVIQESGRVDDGTGDGCVDCIVCPVHRTAFEIQSGQVRGEWCPYPPIIGGVMGYVKPKTGLVKFAVRLKGKNVEVRIATSMKNVDKGDEGAEGMTNIK